jgi:outer membrane protein TolC
MSKNLLFIAATCLSLWQPIHSAAQEKVILDIRQVLDLVETNNKDVAVARRNLSVAEQGVDVANASKLPDISASLSLNFLGDITLMDRDFTNVMTAKMPHFGNTLDVTVYQPVYEGGAISAGVKLAQSQQKMSQTQVEQTRQSVGMQAIGCYLELYKASNLRKVYAENIETTQRVLDEMNARHKEGVVLKNDITRYELRLSTLNYDLLTIDNRISVMNHNLCLLLGLDTGTEIVADIKNEADALPAIESKQQWLDRSVENSLSLKSLNIERDINSRQRSLLNAERMPHIGLVAGDTFAGPISFEVPVINSNYNMWFVGVNVKYNLSSIYKTPKSLTKNRLQREEILSKIDATTEQLDRTIDDTYTQYTQAHRMLETEKKNVELATENYRIVENRYNNQLALLTDMLDASTAKLDADVRLVNARVNIIYYYYQLKYASGTL